jgi:hypothetical protein
MKFRDLQGNVTWNKFFITVFEFIGQFFFQNDVFKLQKDFSKHEIRVFLEKRLGCFQTFLILQIWDKPDVLETFQKQFWKLDSKAKKPRLLCFRKIPCGLFPKPLKEGIFSVSEIFIEDYLSNLTCWSKNRFELSAPKLSKSRRFFSTNKNLLGSEAASFVYFVFKLKSDSQSSFYNILKFLVIIQWTWYW